MCLPIRTLAKFNFAPLSKAENVLAVGTTTATGCMRTTAGYTEVIQGSNTFLDQMRPIPIADDSLVSGTKFPLLVWLFSHHSDLHLWQMDRTNGTHIMRVLSL
jgi:hypothetical protein